MRRRRESSRARAAFPVLARQVVALCCAALCVVVLFFAALCAAATPAAAQEITATGVERGTPTTPHKWRLIYENDLFAATDRFYTQGIYLEYQSEALARSVLRKLLYTPIQRDVRVGVAYGDEGYTGRDLKRADIVRVRAPFKRRFH